MESARTYVLLDDAGNICDAARAVAAVAQLWPNYRHAFCRLGDGLAAHASRVGDVNNMSAVPDLQATIRALDAEGYTRLSCDTHRSSAQA